MIPAHVVEVQIVPRGSSLVAGAATGDTVITVANPTPYSGAGSVLIDGNGYDYTLSTVSAGSDPAGNPVEYGQLTLTPPLLADAIIGMPVTLALGQQLSDVILMVDTLAADASLVPVVVDSAQRDKWSAYEGICNPAIPGSLSDDQTAFTADSGWTPLVDGSLISPSTLPNSAPTIAPATVPLTVYSASGGAAVTWDAPTDVRTRFRLYVAPANSDGTVNTAAPMDATTLWSAQVQPNTIVQTLMQGGDALDPATTYQFALQPYFLNNDGSFLDGVSTGWQVGIPGAYFPTFFSSSAIIQALQAQTVTGLSATFNQATFNNNITIYGGSQSTLSGPMYAAQGVTTPSVAPQVALDYDKVSFNNNVYRIRGLAWHPTSQSWLGVRVDSQKDSQGKFVIDLTAVALDGTVSVNRIQMQTSPSTRDANVTAINPYGIARHPADPDTFYIVYYQTIASGSTNPEGFGTSRVYLSNGAWNIYTANDPSSLTGSNGVNPSTAAIVIEGPGTGVGDQSTVRVVSGDTQRVTRWRYVQGSSQPWKGSWASSSAPGQQEYSAWNQPVFGHYRGNADFGSQRTIYLGPNSVFVATSNGSESTADEWPMAVGSCGGLAWRDDTNAFYVLHPDGVYQYSGIKKKTVSYAYTWRDDDSSGQGTAETLASPVASIYADRQRVTLRLPAAPPDDGTVDGADTASIYGASGSNALTLQTDLTEAQAKSLGPFRYLTAPTTTGRVVPTTSGFEGRPGGIGRYQSAAADSGGSLAQLNGDGSWRLAGRDLDDSGWIAASLAVGSNYGSGYRAVEYRRQGSTVTVRGVLRAPNAGIPGGTAFFTLPTNCRPSLREARATLQGTSAAQLEVAPTGDVLCNGAVAANAAVLVNIQFSTLDAT